MATVRVHIMLKPSLLDSAGRTVADALNKLAFEEVNEVRIGKVIELKMDQVDDARIKAMCDQLLANPVIEDYRFEVIQ